MKTDYTEIKQRLKETLNKDRYFHSIGTADCARKLASEYDLDTEKAYLAGLLHDCAKCMDNKKLMEIIKNNLTVEDCELMNYKTLHAPVSAYLAEKDFGIEDEEILSAIRWHTLGKKDMSDFEKIIYLADKIEGNTREASYSNPIKKCLGKEGIDGAVLQSYKQTIKSLADRELKICPLTIDIYNSLLEKCRPL